jgi:hypothetical protein
MCIAVGKVSLDDWLMLTSSSGAIGCCEPSRTQPSFGDGLIAERLSDLRESWMKHPILLAALSAVLA